MFMNRAADGVKIFVHKQHSKDIFSACSMHMSMGVNGTLKHVNMQQAMAIFTAWSMLTIMDVIGIRTTWLCMLHVVFR